MDREEREFLVAVPVTQRKHDAGHARCGVAIAVRAHWIPGQLPVQIHEPVIAERAGPVLQLSQQTGSPFGEVDDPRR